MKDQTLITDSLSIETIKEGLETECFGQEVIYLPSTASTNLVAKKLAQQGAGEGTLIITDYQTQGKGRLERKWWSPPGENLLFSIIFRPPFETRNTFCLTVLSSLAVAEAIRQESGLEALIKWPNDVYIKGKKVSGILSELEIKDKQLLYMIVGTGINVNSEPSINPEIQDIATSIKLELGRNFPRLRLLKTLLKLVENYYCALKKGDFYSIKSSWDSISMIKGKRVRVVSSGYLQEGIAESIDKEGFLIIKDCSGKRCRIISADVSLSLV